MGKNKTFEYGSPSPKKVTVTSHDGRQIEVEKQIVDALGPGAFKSPAKPATKKEA